MEMDLNTLFALRAGERLVSVVIGGLAIYLGYQMFLRMPTRKQDSEGRLELPGGISIFVSRVGPGVFFALFGAAILGFSFAYPLQLATGTEQEKEARGFQASYLGGGPRRPVTTEERVQALRDLQRLIVLQNQLEQGETQIDASQGNALLISLQRIKRQMLQSVWDEQQWGDYQVFRDWLDHGDPAHPPAQATTVAALYQGSPQ